MNSAAIERMRIESVLHRHGFHFQKKYGQNFITDPDIICDIADAADIGKDDYVLEIGPGVGTLTRELSRRCKRIMCVEIDQKLIPILEEELSGFDNVYIVNKDILKMSVDEINTFSDGSPVKVAANLPYYITTPIIIQLLEGGLSYSTITVMVQKEVAERMCAVPGTKAYGALSLAVQYYTSPKAAFTLEPGAFYPPPKVSSTVITLHKHKTPPVAVKDEKLLFDLIRASFNQRRKTLANGINNGTSLPLTREQVTDIITGLGHPATIRGEALSLYDFAALANAISDKI